MAQIIEALSDISDRYDALFCDLWGCLHNGLEPFADAVAACHAFRAKGGAVVLVTNAPRQHSLVQRQLGRIGVDPACWDAIATSGDSARVAMFTGAVGRNVWFMGEERDRTFFEPMDMVASPVEIDCVPLDEAEGIVCCGPFDPLADPSTLRPELLLAKTKGLPLLCANPDLVVDLGERRLFCAGAVAELYTQMGGESLYFGKPHPPIYDLARRRLAEIGRDVPNERILAIGDGIATDVAGAQGEDIDSVFVTGGLAVTETRTDRQPDPDALAAFLDRSDYSPTYAIGFLR